MGSWPNILKPPCFHTTCAPLEHIPNASEAIVNSNKMLSLVLFFTNARRSVIITSDRQAPRSQGHVKELGRSGRGKCVWVEGQPREPRSPRMAGLSQAGDGGAGAGNALGRAAPREHPETQERSAAVSLGAARTVLSERCPRGLFPSSESHRGQIDSVSGLLCLRAAFPPLPLSQRMCRREPRGARSPRPGADAGVRGRPGRTSGRHRPLTGSDALRPGSRRSSVYH